MSCAMTVEAVRDRRKTVTRRHADTWTTLKAGDRLTLIEKGMGLAKGQKQVVLAEVEIIDVRVETLGLLYEWAPAERVHYGTTYGYREMNREGVTMEPFSFARWWALGHGHRDAWEAGCDSSIECRRIKWRYLS